MGSLQQQTAGEWRYWPERENVTLRVQTALGVYDSYPLTATGGAAKRRSITWKEMTASSGAYTNQDRAWLLPSQNLPEAVLPKPGDQIRDASDVNWTIGDITVGKFGNTYKCVSRALALVHELSAVGTLTRPDNTQDAAGRAALTSYSTVGSPVRCRVQPMDSQAGEVFGRVTIPRQFTAILETPLTVQSHDVFTVTSYKSFGSTVVTGTQSYTVRGFKNAERIWELMEISLELIA